VQTAPITSASIGRSGKGNGVILLLALEGQVLDLLKDPRMNYFDAPKIAELYQRYAAAVDRVRADGGELFESAPLREVPASSGTTDFDGRGYVGRVDLEQLRLDIRYVLDLHEHSALEAQSPTLSVGREGVFVAGAVFDALQVMHTIIASARTSIDLVDGHIDAAALDLMAAKAPSVRVRVGTTKLSQDVRVLARASAAQHGDLEVRKSSAFHDRFLVVDEVDCYHVGLR